MRVTAQELKAHLDEHLAAVEGGEPVTIVDESNDPIAQLEPADDSDLMILHDPTKRLSEFVPGSRPPRLDFDAVQWLLHDRERSRY
jgi:prevent-host-death family protein